MVGLNVVCGNIIKARGLAFSIVVAIRPLVPIIIDPYIEDIISPGMANHGLPKSTFTNLICL